MGFDTVPQSAEELRFSPKKTQLIMIVSILFGAFTYITLNTFAASVVPAGYENWAAYVADLDHLSGIAALPTFHAAYTLLGPVGLILLGIAVLCAVLTGICGFYMATSRLLYSMSRESALPTWFSELHPRYKTPSKAILFILVVSLFAPFFGEPPSFGSWICPPSARLLAMPIPVPPQRSLHGGKNTADFSSTVSWAQCWVCSLQCFF